MSPEERRAAIVEATVPLVMRARRDGDHPADRRGGRRRRGHHLPGLRGQAGAVPRRRRARDEPARLDRRHGRPARGPRPTCTTRSVRVVDRDGAALLPGDDGDDGAPHRLDQRGPAQARAGAAAGTAAVRHRRAPAAAARPDRAALRAARRRAPGPAGGGRDRAARCWSSACSTPACTAPSAASPPSRSPTWSCTASRRETTDAAAEAPAHPPRAVPALAGRRSWCSSSPRRSRSSTCPASTPTSSTRASPPATPTTSCAPARSCSASRCSRSSARWSRSPSRRAPRCRSVATCAPRSSTGSARSPAARSRSSVRRR